MADETRSGCRCLWDWPDKASDPDSWMPDFTRYRDCPIHGDDVLIEALKGNPFAFGTPRGAVVIDATGATT